MMTATAAATTTLPPLEYDPDEVVLEVLPRVSSLARRLARRAGVPQFADDLAQAVCVHLVQSAKQGEYDPGRGTPEAWATWAFRPKRTYRVLNREIRAVDEAREIDHDLLPESPRGRDWPTIHRVAEEVARLPSPHRRMIRELYGVGMRKATPEQISDRRSVYLWPVERIERVRSEGLAMLRERLQGEESAP